MARRMKCRVGGVKKRSVGSQHVSTTYTYPHCARKCVCVHVCVRTGVCVCGVPCAAGSTGPPSSGYRR